MTVSRWKDVPATLTIDVGLVDGVWIDGRNDRPVPASLALAHDQTDATIELHCLFSGSYGVDPTDCDSERLVEFIKIKYEQFDAGVHTGQRLVKVIKDQKVLDECYSHWFDRIEGFEADFDREYDG